MQRIFPNFGLVDDCGDSRLAQIQCSHATSLADDGLDSVLSELGDRENAALVVRTKSGRKYDMAVAVVKS